MLYVRYGIETYTVSPHCSIWRCFRRQHCNTLSPLSSTGPFGTLYDKKMEIRDAKMTFQCRNNPYPGECLLIDIILIMMLATTTVDTINRNLNFNIIWISYIFLGMILLWIRMVYSGGFYL